MDGRLSGYIQVSASQPSLNFQVSGAYLLSGEAYSCYFGTNRINLPRIWSEISNCTF